MAEPSIEPLGPTGVTARGIRIVADDLGSEPPKTDAILDAIERGLVHAASIMATFGDFERARTLAVERGLQNRVGAHLVLTDGDPLTDAMRRSRLFCDGDGRFVSRSGARPLLRLDRDERRLVAGELRAQFEAMQHSGLPVAHVDSHEHVHVQPAIARIVIALARELRVPRIRAAPNLRPVTTRYRASAWLLQRSARRSGLETTRHIGSVTHYLALAPERRPTTDLEVYVHPILAGGRLEDDDSPGQSLEERLEPVIRLVRLPR